MVDKTMIGRRYIAVICIALGILVPATFAASCDNMVRLADLQDIIKDQTKLIQEQGRVIDDQKNMLENQMRLIEDLQRNLQYVTTGKI